MKNNNLSLLDGNQIQVLQHDVEHDAQRVVIVGSEGKQIADSIKESLKDLKVEINTPAPQQIVQPSVDPLVIKIPYQTVVKELEIKEIEKHIFVPEYKVIEIEKSIIVPEIQIVEVEKQIIVKESEPMSAVIKYILVIQTLAVVARVFFEIIHK